MSAVAEVTAAASVLPDGWSEVVLSEVAIVNPETLSGRTDPAFEFGYIDISQIDGPGQCSGWTEQTFGAAPSRARRKVRAGDILVSTVRPYLRSFAQVPEATVPLVASTGFAVVRAGVGADQQFLFQHVLHGNFIDYLTPIMTGSNYPAVSASDVEEYPLRLPPLDEQRRIAEVLRSVDEAIAAADLALAQAKLVQRMTVNELLSPEDTMAGRLCYHLSEVISVAHGFAFKSEFFTTNRDDPVLLTPGNFSVEKTLYFGERTKHYSGPIPDGYVLENGSLVVVMTDLTQDMAILGNAVEINANSVVLHNQRIGRVSLLRPDLISKGYARLLLNSDLVQARVKATASGSTVRHTAPSRILECEVRLPDLDEQARIVAIAKSLDDVVSAEERRRSDVEASGPLSHLRDFKMKIANDLLSGHVRVPA